LTVIAQEQTEKFSVYNSDCVLLSRELPDNSVDFSVYSPPFSSLYVYSESVADMGNVATDEEFFQQYSYLIKEKYRITRPGRLTAIHVKDLVYYQNSSEDGSAGLRAFSDHCTKAHIDAGFSFHCRITIYRDPVLERAKTNAHGLLWKSFKSDASFCRVGMPEYLMVYRKWAKPGDEVKPVTHPVSDKRYATVERWQDLASPVWRTTQSDIAIPYGSAVWNMKESGMGDGDLPATDVLNVHSSRTENAEKHLCPMPLNITERALELWTNEGDVVFSPFMGIGSEGVAALRHKRRFIGTELHPAYYAQAVKNLQNDALLGTMPDLFDLAV
jgi:DNA modification methylase